MLVLSSDNSYAVARATSLQVKFGLLFTVMLFSVLSTPLVYGQAASSLVKEAQELGTNNALTELELGQAFEYQLQWNCSIVSTPPNDCGEFTLTDPLPEGFIFETCLVSDNIYTCTHDPVTNTVTIDLPSPDVLADGDSANATIVGALSTDLADFPSGLPSTLVNTATSSVANVGSVSATSSPTLNPPSNNWEISKRVSVPGGSVGPALDNDVVYRIEICPNGPAGIGTGTIILENPVLSDVCETGATVVGATLRNDNLMNSVLPTTGACPALGFDFASLGVTEFDPADGCQVVRLAVQYPSADFSIAETVTNTANLNGDNIDPATCPNSCTSSVESTLDVPTPDADLEKTVKRDSVGVGARNEYYITFDTSKTNVQQTNVVLEDVFPVEIEPLTLVHDGWSDQSVEANIIELPSNTLLTSYNGMIGLANGFSQLLSATATGFRVEFTTPVPPGFDGGMFTVAHLTNDPSLTVGPPPSTFENCATVTTDQITADPMVSDPSACQTVTIVEDSTDISLAKAMPSAVQPGQPFTTTFTFLQDNTSSVGAQNPTVTDCLSPELEFVSWDTLGFIGLDDPRNAIDTVNTQPIGVEPNLEVIAPGDAGNTCTAANATMLRWSWQNVAPAGAIQLGGQLGDLPVNNPFTFPVRPDRNNDNVGDATGDFGIATAVRLGVTLKVRAGVLAQGGVQNFLESTQQNTADLRCLNGLTTDLPDTNDIDSDADTSEKICQTNDTFNILSAASLGGEKFIGGFPGLPNFDPSNPPADNTAAASAGIATPAYCADDGSGRTKAPCVAQAMKDQPFDYRIRLSNDGNVPLSNYVVYDVLPNTDTAGSDTGISEALAGVSRASTWEPQLMGPVTLASANPTVAAELTNAVIEYSASATSCRPELSIANDLGGSGWQPGCVDDWTETPLADAITFPEGYASVRAWRVYVPFSGNAWPVGDPFNPTDEDIIISLDMLSQADAPASDYVAGDLQIAWNNIAHRATNANDDARLLSAEIVKTGIITPAEFPLQSSGLRIGNLVWLDTNNDGIANAGEQGLFDVTVQLWVDVTGDGPSADDTLFDSMQTDAQGHYLFDDADIANRDNLGIPAGNYYVVIPNAQTGSFVLDDNYSSTTDEPNANSNLDNDDNGAFTSDDLVTPLPAGFDGIYSGTVNLALGEEPVDEQLRNDDAADDDADFFDDNDSNVSVDFGFYRLRLGNHVWLDEDNDGIAESGEPAIANLQTQLYLDDGDGIFDPNLDQLLVTDTTDAQGQYLFDGLDEGNYFIAIPEGQSGLTAGGDPYSTDTLQSSTPTSAAGTALATDNEDDGAPGTFGSLVPATYASVSTLLNLTVGGAVTGESDTSSNGVTGSSATDTSDANVELTENIAADIAFPDTNSYLSADFGFVPDVSLGSTIWVDTNGNGVQNSGEGAIAGATVTLLDSAGTPIDGDLGLAGVQLVQTTTDAAGQYHFNDLVPGTYRVSVDLSTSPILNIDDYLPTPTQVAAPNNNNQLDSNIDYSADTNLADLVHISGPITLLAGTEPSNERDPINATGTGVSTDPDQPNQAGLADNAGNMTLDMGFVPPVSLGSTLWVDDNEDGIQSAGETPVENATVTLLNSDGTVFDSDPYTAGVQSLTTVTDADGQYNFDGLPAGNYRVQVDLSTANNANAATLVPTPRQVADPDAAGPSQNANDDSNIDTGFDTNTTDQIHTSGIVTLTPGAEPLGEVDSIGTPGPDQPNQGLVASDDPDANGNMTVDFGFIEPVSLGSTVWFDSNGDGVQTLGEAPIVGVSVTLLNAGGSVYDSNPATAGIDALTVATDAQGQYHFNGLPEGDYRVQVNLTTATSHTGAMLSPTPLQTPDPDAPGAGQDSNTDSNVDLTAPGHNPAANIYQSGVVSLSIGGEPLLAVESDPIGVPGSDQPNQGAAQLDANGNMTVDMGFFAPVSLGSTIWNDSNADGSQDAGEPAIQGATVTLLTAAGTPVDGDPNVAGVQLVTDVTDIDGQYNFDGLIPGDYRVQVDLSMVTDSDDYIPTPLQVADPDAAGDDNTDSNVDVAFDTNANDLIHTSGIVTLTVGGEPAGETDPIGAGGADQPNQGLSTADDPDTSGNMTVDMGFIKPVSVGSTAWLDVNGDGVQDAGEPPIVAAQVTLLNADGSVYDSDPNVAGVQALTDLTDTQGQYNFNGIPEGDYRIQIDLSTASNSNASALVPTPAQVADPDAPGLGQDNNSDSNIDQLFDSNPVDLIHTSGVITLSVGGEPLNEVDPIGTPGADQPNQALTAADQPDANGNMTVDFGFIEPVSLGSTVWLDSNTDGRQDDNEPPISGALVTLLNGDGSVYDRDPVATGIQALTATTDSTGQYNFNGLPAGSYMLQVDMSGVTGAGSISPTPSQVADPENNDNTDSNIASVDQNGSPAITSDDLYRSGVIDLRLGTEPELEVDPIDGVNDNGPVIDQPNQGGLIDSNGNMTVDFGFFQPVSLGSTIWEDLNGNGIQDAAELAIEGATVTLLDSAGLAVTGVTPVVSNASGEYHFNGLLPGDYRVQVDLSTVVGGADLKPTPLQVADPDLSGDPSEDSNDDSNIDFAFDTTGSNSISDQVHTSGIITLAPGTEPLSETDSIGVVGADQPSQDLTGVNPDSAGNMTLDMGFVRPVSLGSTIWQDENADGSQGDGEPAIVNATVTLLDAAGAPVDGDPYTAGVQIVTTVTDAEGQYFFNDLAPGDYRVQVDLSTVVGGGALIPTPLQVADPDVFGDPSADSNEDSNIDLGFDPNLADQIHTSGVITLTAGGEPVGEADPVDLIDGNGDVDDQPGQTAANPDNSGNMTVDMGFYAPVSIGSFVWQDSNGDGLQDANEPPLAAAQVALFVETTPGSGVFVAASQVGGAPVTAVTVGADGLYEFTNLPPGNYRVQVTPPTGFFPSPVQNTADNDDTANDSNIATEPSVGVFESGVFEVTSGAEPNETGSGTGRGDNQDGIDGSAEDLSGNMTIDFGFVPPASLGNYVWLDLDMDGVQDANEDGIANVTVNLYQDTDGNGVIDGAELTTPVATAVTGLNGEYLFPRLQPGVVYQTGVDVSSLPVGLVQTYDEGDGVGATDSLSDPIVLDPKEFHETADFGYAPAAGLGAVGDTIWVDANDDGVQSPGEPGIGNVTVSITPPTDVDLGAGLGVAITTVTDSSGRYLFPNLPLDESYIVEVDTNTLPLGYVSGPSNLGDPDVRDGNSATADNQTTVTITPANPINLDLDFGYLPPADQNNSIGDTLWIDVDQDGNGPATAGDGSDLTEPVLHGVTVTLIQDNGDGLYNPADDTVFATTVTDATGMYLFTGIPDGDYIVVVTDQNNVLAGLNQTVDSDDPANPGAFVAVTPNRSFVDDLGVGIATPVEDLDQDFGYVSSNTAGGDGVIGDTIFFDSNGSGAPDADEGLEGVVVELYGPGPDGVIGGGDDVLISTTTTDANGLYLFTGLDTSDTGANPGTDYQVVVVTSTLPNGGTGWTNSVDPDTSGTGDSVSVTTLTTTTPIDLDQDFGYVGDGDNAITGTIWPDTNGNGEQDEAGSLGGVTVELQDQNGNVIATTTTDTDGNYEFAGLPDGVYVVVVTDDDNVLNGFEHTDSPNGLTDTSDETSKDDTGYVVDLDSLGLIADPVIDNTGDFGYVPSITNPISLGLFTSSVDEAGSVRFDWSTQTEVANIGFNVYAQVDGDWIVLNPRLIASYGDAVSVQSYHFSAVTDATVFALSDIDLTGKETLHGPYVLGQSYGVIADRQAIDWQSEKAIREANKAERKAKREAQQRQRSLKRKQRRESKQQETSMFYKLLNQSVTVLLTAIIPTAHAAEGEDLVNLQTTEVGIHYISVADLAEFGVDLIGENAADLALSNRGNDVPIQVTGGAVVAADSQIRFIAEQLDTLYTGTNVYTLRLESGAALPMNIDTTAISSRAKVANSYLRTAKFAPQSSYSFTSPNPSDAFYAKRMIAIGEAASENVTLNLKNVAVGGNSGTTKAKLRVGVWGAANQAGVKKDHSVSVKFNGVSVASKEFDGLRGEQLEASLQEVREGINVVGLTLPLDTGYAFDAVNLDDVTVEYPSKFVAEDARLSYASNFSRFRIDGFKPTDLPNGKDDLVIMRQDTLSSVAVIDGNGKKASCNSSVCRIEVAGSGAAAQYYVATSNSMYSATPVALPLADDISSGNANYLIISHPDFIGSAGNFHLENLATELQSEMGSVDIVDVESIYAQFGDHIFDPQAIRDYIQFAHNNRGTKYVLLVGGDVYDYRNFENQDATSFIPSIYYATGNNITFAPVDAKYVDLNDDNVPDLPIARLPVRTTAQLGVLMGKRAAYLNRDYAGTALLVADGYDQAQQYDFGSDANEIEQDYLLNFQVEKAYVDQLGTSAARAKVKQQIESGITLTAFFGHSSTNQWSFNGLFTGPDAAGLNNVGKPTVVTQWGCWNAYFVSPNEDSMGHRFMMEGDRGAVAVMGASTLTDANNERELARLVFDRLANGERLGDAVTNAKQDYALENPDDLDVLLGWTVLGLPELIVN
ncbi:SdrD B-like domain-containing protein [Arenicella xantha]|uniref:Putative secreted protein (Por secretion system target) n=1 Tax=Arenicella xantha TaxID=644221 RepID=A0A395JSI2_9GAMM|nr:SdrD B-like domain-containing protein [Arenicella xantha]RBP53495.1 putative secreted protein (Por secretion system target) [Arenicella xantha]